MQLLVEDVTGEPNDVVRVLKRLARNLPAIERGLDQLESNLGSGDKEIYRDYVMDTNTGRGFLEAPRGALSHWIDITNSATNRYQMVVPTTWNASPRDAAGKMSAYESSLIDTPVADEDQPLEMLRTIHSFDPCMACAVHLYNEQGEHISRIQVLG